MHIVFMILLVVLSVFSCSLPKTARRPASNLADIYNPSRATIHPDFLVNHINDSVSVIYIRIYPAELLFNQANEQGDFLAKIEIGYILSQTDDDSEKKGIMVDSATISKTLDRSQMRNSFFTAIPLKASFGHMYMVKVSIEDKLRRSITENYLVVDKTSPYDAENFRVISSITGYPAFTRVFTPEEKFRIFYNQLGYDSLFVDYYEQDRSLPRPIFSTAPDIPVKSYPDSTYTVPFNDSALYELPERGIYHFRVNLQKKEGLSLFNFGENFPTVKTVDDLLGPLVYLTSSAVFLDIRMESNRKLAIDNFWLKIAVNMDAARELIRVYYNRVLYANLYFTSYKEGWKTDRGMVYIIFGSPNMLDKSIETEKWTYFSKRSASPIEFVFKREANLFTYQDYVLNRNASSTGYWAEAVRSWKRGKIYAPEY